MGGERNKHRLSPRLVVFQFMENQGLFGLFGFKSWTFWDLLGSETLGMDGYLIYRGRGGLSLVFGVVVVEFLGFVGLSSFNNA